MSLPNVLHERPELSVETVLLSAAQPSLPRKNPVQTAQSPLLRGSPVAAGEDGVVVLGSHLLPGRCFRRALPGRTHGKRLSQFLGEGTCGFLVCLEENASNDMGILNSFEGVFLNSGLLRSLGGGGLHGCPAPLPSSARLGFTQPDAKQVPRCSGVQMGYVSRAGALLGEGRGRAAKKAEVPKTLFLGSEALNLQLLAMYTVVKDPCKALLI